MAEWFSWETLQRNGPQSFSEPKFNSKPSLHPWMGKRQEERETMTEVFFEIPTSDPCWYCHCPPGDDLVFSWEFDTFVHLACIRDRLASDPTDREVAIFAREFGLPGAPPAPVWNADEQQEQALREAERDHELRASDGRIAD